MAKIAPGGVERRVLGCRMGGARRLGGGRQRAPLDNRPGRRGHFGRPIGPLGCAEMNGRRRSAAVSTAAMRAPKATVRPRELALPDALTELQDVAPGFDAEGHVSVSQIVDRDANLPPVCASISASISPRIVFQKRLMPVMCVPRRRPGNT